MCTVSKTASVQFSSVTQSCPTLCDTPGLPVHDQHARTPCPWPTTKVCSSSCPFSDAIQPPHPLSSSPLLPSIFPSIRVFSSESVLCVRLPKYWRFSFSISPSINIQDWFPLGLIGLISLQSKGLSSSKASILWHSAFFMVQLSHLYMTTEKNIDLTRWTFESKVMSLLFNMLSRFVIAFLPRSKHLLISCR